MPQMEDTRTRRVHRACEPCRRKKVKCSGDRPICSFCRRLRQPCNYELNEPEFMQLTQDGTTERRIENIEGKLDQLLQCFDQFKSGQPSAVPSVFPPVGVADESVEAPPRSEIRSDTDATLLFPDDQALLEAGQLYQKWCHNQPLSLFNQEGFVESLKYRDRELCLAIRSLSCRYPPGVLTPEMQGSVDAMTNESRTIVMDRVTKGKVKLSTLQTLVLLSTICFSNGSVVQAGLDLGMAQYFVCSLPAGSSLGDPAEYASCVRSISLLQNNQGCIYDTAKAASADNPSKHSNQQSGPFSCRSNRLPSFRDPSHGVNTESGILAYVSQVAEAWMMVRIYAAAQVGSHEPPPWDPHSDYSLIMLRHMELDCQYPLKYRFATNNFGGFTSESLQQRRDYWGPWLFQQFVYSAIPALVNHPFLLSMRLKSFRHTMPQTFIHQSFDQISRHCNWIICFLDLIEKQQFKISDPLIAHCIAIVATIHLQHSFVKDDTLRQKARNGYDKCIKSLDRMAPVWPCIASMARNLRKLQDSITMVSSTGGQASTATNPPSSWSIDAQLLWDILIYEKAVQDKTVTDKSMFSDLITLDVGQREQNIAEFAIIGSVGISGHKTVSSEVTAYAPSDFEQYGTVNDPVMPAGMINGFDADEGRLFEVLGNTSQMGEQDNTFLQAGDFGQAIENWLNFDII